jgi:hypothetical protein
MIILRALIFSLVLVASLLAGDNVIAQIPPHPPGTICFTPNFWCWAQPPGPPNSPCVCVTQQGLAQGFRG